MKNPRPAGLRPAGLLLAGLLAGGLAPTASASGLPRLQIEPGSLTVSGVSSGGYMATQFHVSHAALVSGAGIFAAGPWFCAQGAMSRALAECFDRPASQPDPTASIAAARRAAAARRIDDLALLANDRVWVFRGTRDDRVVGPVADAGVAFYRAFVAPQNLVYVTDVGAAHGVPTLAAGGACDVTAAPFLNACDYDGVGHMLSFLYGGLTPPAPAAGGDRGGERLTRFDQRRYDPTGSLAAAGFVFVPQACARGARCRLHVAFHGCRQGAEYVGDAFVRDAGYTRWADAHGIVVVFPQARQSLLLPFNPQGCWDWWGYQDPDYATQAGTQTRAIRAMVQAVAGF